jgi:hypothetical protein
VTDPPLVRARRLAEFAAYQELQQRRAAGDEPPLLARLICHGRTVYLIWDLGPGEALAVPKTTARNGPRVRGVLREYEGRYVDAASLTFLVEQDFEEVRPHWCSEGKHGVEVSRLELREIVTRARRSTRRRTLKVVLDQRSAR